MKILATLLISAASSLFVCTPAWSQTGGPAKPEPPLKAPPDPGMPGNPDPGMKPPSGSGMVVVPPKTDQEAVVKPPSNVDPAIHSSTQDKDNQGTAQDKEKPHTPR